MTFDKILVIGKNSYIGRHLNHFFEAEGKSVISLSSKECNFLSLEQAQRFFESLEGCELVVIFLAVIGKSPKDGYQHYIDNITLVRNFIEAQKGANIKSIIYLSSVDVYGRNPQLPITEKNNLDPDSWYSLAKQTCEWMLMKSEDVKYPVTVLRIPGIFGKGVGDKSIISKMISEIKTGKVSIYGSGKIKRDYVYVEDLCRIINHLISINYQGVLNAVTGRSFTILELVDILRHAVKDDICVIREEPNVERSFDLVFDNSLFRSTLPDFKFENLDVGIQTYIRD